MATAGGSTAVPAQPSLSSSRRRPWFVGFLAALMFALVGYADAQVRSRVFLDQPDVFVAGDLFWYVKANSPIKNLADADGKTIASADLAVSNNVPVRWMVSTVVPVVAPKKPTPITRRRNV